jgi:hypothetical protein
MSRSQSRGREEYGSSGRGGAGNIRPQSRDPVARTRKDGVDDYSPSRGREIRNNYDEPVTHSGRGGAGNVRSRSRNPEDERKALEADSKLVKDYDSHQTIHSSGRGGVGNIDRSRSRDPAHNSNKHNSNDRPPASTQHPEHHTAGRGGYGNTYQGGVPDPNKAERTEEGERSAYRGSTDTAGVHTSGRGGYGNTSAPGTGTYDTQAPHHPNPEHHTYASGRGGVGNIHYDQ